MTTDLETLRGALRARAEGHADGDELLRRIRPAYRRRRHRRAVAAAAAVVVATGLTGLLVPRLLPGQGVPVPPSAAAPDGIGSDPQTIHFDVGRFPYPVRTTTWSVSDGVEKLSLWGNTVTFDEPKAHDDTEFFVDLTLARATASPAPPPSAAVGTPQDAGTGSPAAVGGQEALVVTGTNPYSSLAVTRITWRPTPGVRAELSVRGPVPVDRALAFAGTLRLDAVHRCSPRVRPTTLPTGARVTGCSTTADSLSGQLTVRGPKGTITVSTPAIPTFDRGATPGRTAGPGRQLPRLANGWPYEELDPSGSTQNFTAYIRVPDPYVELWSQGGYGLSDVLLVAGGLELSSR